MHPSKLKILSQRESGFVGTNERYDFIHVYFKNLMLNFSLAEFVSFRSMTKDLIFDDCLVALPNGDDKVILRTPFEGINFAFDRLEMHNLVEVLDEAYYMREIHVLLKKS